MSLQVFFDGTLINEDYYTKLTNSYELFNESFKLGATPCNTYKLQIAKEAVQTAPSHVTLKDSGTTFAELEIDNIEEIDDTFVELTLTDKMVDLDFRYDASEIFQNGSTTLLLIVQDICTKAGLNLGTVDFRGYDKAINWYDNTRTAREYIGMVAELNGGFARIENNTLYFRKQNTLSAKTIDVDDCADFKIGEYHKITRVVYELGATKYEYGDETGNTLYLDSENVYITEASEVEAIYNEMKDFEFYSFNTSICPIDYSVKAGDVITFTFDNNNYPTIAQYDLEYFGDWIGGYSLEVNTERQENTKIIGEKDKIRDLKIIVDRQNNTITQVVSEVDEQNTKISQTQQSVNELNSKIQDIADITTQAETIYASLSFTGINQSEPIEVKIRPTTTNISYLYPRNNLYPSDTLYMPNRILRFTNTTTYEETEDTIYLGDKDYFSLSDSIYTLLVAGTDYIIGNPISGTIYQHEIFDYELPDDLLVSGNGVYDEFYLGYDEQICQVTKRCEYNADGTVSELASEVVHSYTYPIISLTDGNYTVELLGYSNAYMSIRLMAQNIYTTQFATKAELNSEISQTTEQIQSTVSATYETKQNAQTNYSQLTQTANGISSRVSSVEDGKADKNEIISEINQSAEAVAINANKINLNGAVTANNNFKILTDGSMEATNGTFTSGKVSLVGGSESDANFELYKDSNKNVNERLYALYNFLVVRNSALEYVNMQAGASGTSGIQISENSNTYISLYARDTWSSILLNGVSGSTQINNTGIYTPQLTQTSKEEDKKNFEKLQNGLDIVKNTDIYKYNLKSQTDNEKKHIGFVIGKNYKYAHEITAEDEGKEVGVDTYSMISVAYKAIQEQQEQIEELQKEIKELKGEK